MGKIRAYGSDCPLDAGGLPLHWLTDVKPAQSVALLLRFAGEENQAPTQVHRGAGGARSGDARG